MTQTGSVVSTWGSFRTWLDKDIRDVRRPKVPSILNYFMINLRMDHLHLLNRISSSICVFEVSVYAAINLTDQENYIKGCPYSFN